MSESERSGTSTLAQPMSYSGSGRVQPRRYMRPRSTPAIKQDSVQRRTLQEKTFSADGSCVRVIPLGGLEEIGRNLTVFECGEDIIVVDVGLGFPEWETMPGVDFVIPNVQWLKEHKDRIRGVLLTHGHYDHIGALPYVLDQLGNPPLYATPLTKGLVLRRQQEFASHVKPRIIEIRKDHPRTLRLGAFSIDYFHVNHTIPDSVGFLIKTPVGKILHTGDFKIDFTPMSDLPVDIPTIVRLAGEGVQLMLVDSTNANKPGHIISERKIMENLEEIFQRASGRIIAATFAALVERLQQMVWLSEKYQRRIVIEGHSMRINCEVAKQLGHLKIQKGTLIRAEDALGLDPRRLTILCTGSQGEDRSVLTRIAAGEHRFFKVMHGDSIIFSSSIIPGNERAVQHLRDTLSRQGANVYHYQMMDIHASGHAYADDIRLMINIVKPKFVMPIHGYYYLLRANEEVAASAGVPKERVVIAQNGQVVEMTAEDVRATRERVPANFVFVDGLGVGDVGEVVLRDRQAMAQDGMFVIIAVIDSQTGDLKTNPDIISRGFVYLRESKELMRETRELVRKIVKRGVKSLGGEWPVINEDYIKNNIREELGDFLFQKTHRRPVVLPVVIQV